MAGVEGGPGAAGAKEKLGAVEGLEALVGLLNADEGAPAAVKLGVPKLNDGLELGAVELPNAVDALLAEDVGAVENAFGVELAGIPNEKADFGADALSFGAMNGLALVPAVEEPEPFAVALVGAKGEEAAGCADGNPNAEGDGFGGSTPVGAPVGADGVDTDVNFEGNPKLNFGCAEAEDVGTCD